MPIAVSAGDFGISGVAFPFIFSGVRKAIMTESSGTGNLLYVEAPMAPSISGVIQGTGTVEHFRMATATTLESIVIDNGSEVVLKSIYQKPWFDISIFRAFWTP